MSTLEATLLAVVIVLAIIAAIWIVSSPMWVLVK